MRATTVSGGLGVVLVRLGYGRVLELADRRHRTILTVAEIQRFLISAQPQIVQILKKPRIFEDF